MILENVVFYTPFYEAFKESCSSIVNGKQSYSDGLAKILQVCEERYEGFMIELRLDYGTSGSREPPS